jgi:CyaY protein
MLSMIALLGALVQDVMEELKFDTLADTKLHALETALDSIESIEAELSQGILTIEFEEGQPFLINSHRAARQIWMAAERSAWHFDPNNDGSRWVCSKDPHEELNVVLEKVLSNKLGVDIKL